jgi:hypothetical protein
MLGMPSTNRLTKQLNSQDFSIKKFMVHLGTGQYSHENNRMFIFFQTHYIPQMHMHPLFGMHFKHILKYQTNKKNISCISWHFARSQICLRKNQRFVLYVNRQILVLQQSISRDIFCPFTQGRKMFVSCEILRVHIEHVPLLWFFFLKFVTFEICLVL